MILDISCKYFDIIIIGAGGAGLMSALSASEGNNNIAVISKVLPNNSHTVSAKGGINASLGNVSKDDWRWHAFDTMQGSAGIADEEAVDILCKNANDAIIFLEKIGVVFSRDENHKIAQRAYGGQRTDNGKGGLAYRACYSKDNTGQTILHSLYQQAVKNNVKFFNDYFVIDLIMQNNICIGCLALDLNNGEMVNFVSKVTILATGGFSQIYQNTTSSTICTGDGTALALRAGLELQDMEFVQFHPTGIYGSGFLITEASRGEGGYLLNKHHKRFMQDYDPQMMELSCRDLISQAMATEIAKGNGAGENGDYLYLDLRHLSASTMKNKLPSVLELVNKFLKLDARQDLIPIAPSAHYTMGGVPAGVDCVVSQGLMAVGEVACHSVHGANRLGCNSLLDLIVFGKIAGESAVLQARQLKLNDNIQLNNSKELQEFNNIFAKDVNHKNSFSIAEIKKNLQKNNEKTLGVFRNHELILEGINRNLELYKNLQNYKIISKNLIWNDELIAYLELKNLLLNALAVGFSAIARTESRGSHYRSDYNFEDNENFLAHSLVKIHEQNNDEIKMEIKFKKIYNNKFTN